MNDDKFFGSIIGLIADVIAFFLLFFGGGKEILWLCIIGFVVLAIGIMGAFSSTTNGLTNVLAIGLAMCAVHFFGEKLLSFGLGGDIYNWLIAGDGVFYFARLLAVCIIVSALVLVLSISNEFHNSRGN